MGVHDWTCLFFAIDPSHAVGATADLSILLKRRLLVRHIQRSSSNISDALQPFSNRAINSVSASERIQSLKKLKFRFTQSQQLVDILDNAAPMFGLFHSAEKVHHIFPSVAVGFPILMEVPANQMV
jgi:hypothetical protein